jgi:hypothetical protein
LNPTLTELQDDLAGLGVALADAVAEIDALKAELTTAITDNTTKVDQAIAALKESGQL